MRSLPAPKKSVKCGKSPPTELARRGIDYILSVYAREEDTTKEWKLPEPRSLGWKGLSHQEIKAEAQLANTELQLTRPGKA